MARIKYVNDEERRKAQAESVAKYKEDKKIKRVPLDMREEELDLLKQFAAAHGETVTGFIRQAIKDRMQAMGD